MTRLVIVLAILLPACAGDLNTWRLGDGFDGTKRGELFRAAASQWCQAAELCAEISDDGANVVQVSDDVGDGNLAWYDPDADGATISVLSSLSNARLMPILLHELGHHWGCDDNRNPESIMYFSEDRTVEALTPDDIECAR